MIYPPRDSIRRRKKRWMITSILLGFLVIVVILNFFAPQIISPLTHAAGLPVLRTRIMAIGGASELIDVLHSKRTLLQENRELRQKMLLMSALEIERNALKSENEQIKAMLGRSTSTIPVILAQILSKPGYSPYDTLILDVGEQDGVKVGDLVLVENTLVVGEIMTVQGHSSNALLYSSPEHKTEVFIGQRAVQATAVGKGGGNFEVRVPRNTEFQKGDEVRLSHFPDIVFGSVTDINGATADTFERVLFRSLIDVSDVRFVTIKKQH
jgi:cell shape-determining protein MreC